MRKLLQNQKDNGYQKFITKCDRDLLQSALGYYKMRQTTVIKKLLQSAAEVYYKVRQVLQSVTACYYKVCQVLHSVTVITK